MGRFVVILERTRAGQPVGTTRDIVEADTVEDAIRLAVEAWDARDPHGRYRYQELFAGPAQGE
jgi:hypothetical protein